METTPREPGFDALKLLVGAKLCLGAINLQRAQSLFGA
jgi:hypothetical protein